MIKKIGQILAVLMLMAFIPVVFAEDTNTIDANTIEEVKAFNTPLGAEVRLMQLEKSITKNVLVGGKTIEIIEKNHPDINISEAEVKLDELESLLNEVKSYLTEENLIEGKDKNYLVVEFVAMKKEAITLTQEFRQIVIEVLTATDKQEIKEATKDLDKNQLRNMNQLIRETIRSHNAEKIENILSIIGVDNPQLIQSIIDGNATKQEVKSAVKEAYADLNAQERQRIWAEMREKTTKRIVGEKALIQNAKEKGIDKFLEIESKRLQKLSDWLEKRGNDLNAKGYEQRAERINNWVDKIGQKFGKD